MNTIVKISILFLLIVSCKEEKMQIEITNLQIEQKANPLGVDIENPRFSWNMESLQRGAKQSAYQILVASSAEKLKANEADIWDSKKIVSDKSIQIYYDGKTLESNRKYYWKVLVWDNNGDMREGGPAFWTTGLFKESDWKAKWIGLDKAVGSDRPNKAKRVLSARWLRKEFQVPKVVKSATVYISGLGLYELYLNGNKVGDQVLAPALSEYDKKSFYNTFDVTQNLQSGKNAIGVILGNGRFFAPRSIIPSKTRNYGFPKVICQLEIEYEDGSTGTIVTDESWKLTTNGPIRKNNEYDGAYYDARMEMSGWDKPGFDASKWVDAELVAKPGKKLAAQLNEPIKIMEELSPVSVKELKKGMFIFDMGQNMVGWVELSVKGQKGDKVQMRFAETLNEDGSIFLENLRSAEVTDTYILKGDEKERWEPRFTYHGFRYVEMTGYPGKPDLSSIKGKVVYDAVETTGSFACSNPLINSIYKNAYWGIRGNYRSIPTDCPQRDERHGWLGDRSAECTGESYIFNISNLYSKWMGDVRDAQRENGSIADVAPSYWPLYNDNTTWPGTYLFASDMLYTQYGDLKTIETNYPHMQKWIEHMEQYITDGIMPKDTYGDWCVPPEDLSLIHTIDPLRTTSSAVIGTAYFYTELKLMAKFAKLLGKKQDAADYLKKAEAMKIAFNEHFLDKNNVQYSNNSHTTNILALAFDLVPEQYIKGIKAKLLQKILGESNSHVGNGIIGGQWLMRTLTDAGYADVAYTLATEKSYPSWGYMVEQGATTIWELWNGDKGDPGMNSGNHVMLLGDLIIWFYEDLAGIKADPEIPAFKHIVMKLYVLGDLTNVTASYKSVYGEIRSAWKLGKDKFKWDVTIPANTTATVYVPTLNKEDVLESSALANDAKGVKFIRWEGNRAIFEIESGSYSFVSDGIQLTKTQGYTATPVITPYSTSLSIGDKIAVKISCRDKDAKIHYTLDGTEPNKSSSVYTVPIELTNSTNVKARAYKEGYKPSMPAMVIYDFIDKEKNGITWTLYKGQYSLMPDISTLKPRKKGSVFQFSLDDVKSPKHNFIVRFESFIKIDEAGEYKFYTSSNDGSKLYIDDKQVVDNDGLHGPVQQSGRIKLDAGMHKIRVDYFQAGGSKVLMVFYSSDKIEYRPIPGSVLFKDN